MMLLPEHTFDMSYSPAYRIVLSRRPMPDSGEGSNRRILNAAVPVGDIAKRDNVNLFITSNPKQTRMYKYTVTSMVHSHRYFCITKKRCGNDKMHDKIYYY